MTVSSMLSVVFIWKTISTIWLYVNIHSDWRWAIASLAAVEPAGRAPALQFASCASHPCGLRLSILYFEGVNQYEGILCQQQLRLQRQNGLRQPKRIFYRWRAPITSNFMSVTPSRRPIFTKTFLVS